MRWLPNNLPGWQNVATERVRQIDKWGTQHHAPEWWAVILTEEVGEFAQAIFDLKQVSNGTGDPTTAYEHMRTELVQVAAVALSALADLDGTVTFGQDMSLPLVPSVAVDPARWWEPARIDPTAVRDEPPVAGCAPYAGYCERARERRAFELKRVDL